MTNTALPDPMESGSDKPWPKIPVPHTALRGPADPDAFRTYVGRSKNRWYIDPLNGDDVWPEDDPANHYPAVSTVKKASGADWSLVACKRIAEATVHDPQRFVGKDFTDIYELLKADDKRGLRHASERGTNVHTYFEKGLYGQDITYTEGPHEPGADYLPAVREFFAAYQPTLVAAEYVAINRGLNGVGYGCTGDAIAEITNPKGERVLAYIDWKSRKDEGNHAIYPEEAAQIAAARFADYMIIDGPEGAVRAPMPETDLGLIVSIRPDSPRVYPVALGKAFEHWTSLHRWWVARKAERDSISRVWPLLKPRPLMQQLLDTTSRDQALLLWRLHKDGGLWTDEHTEAMKVKWPAS